MASVQGQFRNNAPFFKVTVASGVAANTNIAVSGIATTDLILAVLGIDGDNVALASTVVDHSEDTTITSAGNVQSTAVTTTERLIIMWLDIQP